MSALGWVGRVVLLRERSTQDAAGVVVDAFVADHKGERIECVVRWQPLEHGVCTKHAAEELEVLA